MVLYRQLRDNKAAKTNKQKEITTMTKNQLKAKYVEYLATPSRCVKDVYARPSTNKIRAEYRIIDYIVDHDGYGYRLM